MEIAKTGGQEMGLPPGADPWCCSALLPFRGHRLALSLLHSARLHPSFAPTRPPADAYDAVVDALGRARQFDAAWRVVVDAAADGAASPRTFAVLARRLVAAGMTRQAIRAFDDMEAFVGREPDAVEFATLLDTLCKYKYPKVRDPETSSCMLGDNIVA